MERIVAGPVSWGAADGQRAVLLLGRHCVLGGRPGLPQCRSARTKSGVSNRCGRQRAVDDGRAGHMEHTVAGLVSWETVDGRRAGLLLGRRGCLADGPCSRSARVELRDSSTCGRRRAVDDGRAGHIEHAVAGPDPGRQSMGSGLYLGLSYHDVAERQQPECGGQKQYIPGINTVCMGTTKYIHCINLT